MHTVSLQAEKQFVSTYDRAIATGMQKGILQGRQEGKQEGLLTAKREIALTMLQEGSIDEFIIKVTGLTIKQLQEVKANIRKC